MTSLTTTEIGSIVLNLVSDIPTTISGLLPTIVDQQRINAQNITGNTIGVPITETYQSAITNMTLGVVIRLMDSQGIRTNSVNIEGLSISKGVTTGIGDYFYQMGINELNEMGGRISFYQCWG